MTGTERSAGQGAAVQRLLRGATGLFILLMPLSSFFAVGPSANPRVFWLYAQRGLFLSDFALAALVLLALVGKVPWRRGPVFITGALIAICMLAFFSIPGAISPPFALYSAVRWTLALFVYFWFLQPVVATNQAVKLLALSIGMHCLVGILQVVLQSPLHLPGELAVEPATPGAAILLVDGVRWLRAYGLTFHPNVLGGYAAVAILLMIPALDRFSQIALWWLLWCGLLITFSRSAWLAVVLLLPFVVLVAILRRFGETLKASLAGGGLLLLVIGFLWVAGGQITNRLDPLASVLESGEVPAMPARPAEAPESFSLAERSALIAVAAEIIAAHPIRGAGAGNFGLALAQIRPQLRAQAVHNVPLLIASEVGLAGGALWLFLTLVIAMRFIRHMRRASLWRLCAIAACLASLIISLLDSYPWSLNSGMMLMAMTLGLASRANEATI